MIAKCYKYQCKLAKLFCTLCFKKLNELLSPVLQGMNLDSLNSVLTRVTEYLGIDNVQKDFKDKALEVLKGVQRFISTEFQGILTNDINDSNLSENVSNLFYKYYLVKFEIDNEIIFDSREEEDHQDSIVQMITDFEQELIQNQTEKVQAIIRGWNQNLLSKLKVLNLIGILILVF